MSSSANSSDHVIRSSISWRSRPTRVSNARLTIATVPSSSSTTDGASEPSKMARYWVPVHRSASWTRLRRLVGHARPRMVPSAARASTTLNARVTPWASTTRTRASRTRPSRSRAPRSIDQSPSPGVSGPVGATTSARPSTVDASMMQPSSSTRTRARPSSPTRSPAAGTPVAGADASGGAFTAGARSAPAAALGSTCAASGVSVAAVSSRSSSSRDTRSSRRPKSGPRRSTVMPPVHSSTSSS